MASDKSYRVIVSERAAQLLISHASFLAQVSFEEAAQSLAFMPQRCAWLAGDYIPRHAYRFIVFEKRYMIIFQIKDDEVYADYVVDCRQDYRWLFRP